MLISLNSIRCPVSVASAYSVTTWVYMITSLDPNKFLSHVFQLDIGNYNMTYVIMSDTFASYHGDLTQFAWYMPPECYPEGKCYVYPLYVNRAWVRIPHCAWLHGDLMTWRVMHSGQKVNDAIVTFCIIHSALWWNHCEHQTNIKYLKLFCTTGLNTWKSLEK